MNESLRKINEPISYVYDGMNELVCEASLYHFMPHALAHEAPLKAVVIPKESNCALLKKFLLYII